MISSEPKSENMKMFGFGYEAMKSIKICKKCGKPANVNRLFCKNCGALLSRKTLFDFYKKRQRVCQSCKTVLSEQSEYCPECGRKIMKKEVGNYGNNSKFQVSVLR